MDHCIYCKREVSTGSRTCEDCADYEAAVRIADRILDGCNIEGAALAASLGAEIMREHFLRSVRGGRARKAPRPDGELSWPRTSSLA
ncbi:MAG TPA: hypothetical protein VM899_07295 [Rubellimicrobium sp.]|jgi:hypothetical protein|nr:hypothetical protein [Rubellimicrobium sp.]